jgi:hypothetical protein
VPGRSGRKSVTRELLELLAELSPEGRRVLIRLIRILKAHGAKEKE